MEFIASLLALGAVSIFAIIVVGLLILAFEVWMFVDAILNEAIPSERKVLWLIGMVLLHPFVAIAYYFTDHKRRVF